MSRPDATALAEQVRQGETTATALLDQALARIEAAAELRAVVHVQADAARARASSPLDGPFAGVPLLAKDLLPYPGLRAAMGCALFAGHVPEHPLPYTEALDRAGLLCIGKTATSELGLLGSTETRLEGVTRNPWGAEWSAGGSSGGAAAAVAAGLVPMAHASDGGGSIRLPAALHGLFGFKPSGGAMLSATPMENDFSALVAEHAITQTVRDSATLFFATQQHPTEHVRSAEGLKRLRIGVYTTDAFGQPASAEALTAVETAAALCAELGHQVERVEAPRIDGQAISDSFFTLAGGFLAGLDQMMTPMLGRPLGPMDVEPFTWALLQRFRSLGPDSYPRALAAQQAQGAAMRSFLSQLDVTLCPTVGGERPALGHLAPHLPLDVLLARTQRLAGFTAIHNSAGAPAMSVPLCSSNDGLPVGVQFAASPGGDDTLLRLAFELEQASPWIDRLPIG